MRAKNTYLLIIHVALCIIAALTSCKQHSSYLLEKALRFAGDNRPELEKTLNYYKKDPKDSLKYRAAVFLIENMPYCYTLQSEKLDLYRNELYQIAVDNRCPGEKAMEILEEKYGKLNAQEYERIYDSQTISSLYLINAIEQAFKVWREAPWGNRIAFQTFCEQILPYRIAHEPLESWRETYYNAYQPVLDSLLQDSITDPVRAVDLLYDSIVKTNWVFFENIPLPYIGANNLLKNRIGNCSNRTELSTYIMRALGIPGGTDFILQYPNRTATGHSWNFVQDAFGKPIAFSLYEERPGEKPDIELKKGKVYRKFFNVQFNSLPFLLKKQKDIPPAFRTIFIKDVSQDYLPSREIKVAVDARSQQGMIMYLATFNNREWVPIAWSEIAKKQAAFQYIDENIVYLPLYYQAETIIPASYPVLIDENGICRVLKPDNQIRQTLTLHRKYPVQPWWKWFTYRPVGGKFQGANHPQFRNAATFYTITDTLDMQWHQVSVPDNRKYRYVRYLSAKQGHCNMAELQFVSEADSLLKGEIIGTDGSYYNEPKDMKTAVFDKDPLTFYEAKEPDDSWAGLDFGTPQRIKTIEYLFRNDDNGIRIGDEYELFYWDENRWNSIGKQTAAKNVLSYDSCPTGGALFWLHNHSRGKEERIFTYENGKPVWW
jgi:hypothetical protein